MEKLQARRRGRPQLGVQLLGIDREHPDRLRQLNSLALLVLRLVLFQKGLELI